MSNKSITTATKEEAEPALVPRLRFPKFRKAEGWKGVPLSKLVSTLDAGVSVNSGDRPATGNELGILKTSAVTNGVFEPQENKVVFDEVERGRVREPVQGGTIIISRMNTPALVGANAYIETSLGNIYLPDRLWAAKSKPGTSMRFVAAILGSDKGRAALSKLAKGSSGSMKNITKSDVLALLIVAPSPAEQQKVADCLSLVDKLMAAQARKVAALKTHKKGLMQQLLPREGETQPRLRFLEFQNAGEWEEVALGDIAEIKLGKMLDKQKHTTGLILPYLNNLAVRWDEVNTSDLPKMYFNDRELDRFGLRAGDVVVCEGGEPGRAAVWDGRLPDLKFQKAIHRVRFNVPFEPKILVLHLENLAGTTEFEMLFTGGGIKHLTGETFSRLKIPLIPHAEQQRIAKCLSTLNALIIAETQKHQALKTHKKGLMQQLFPSPEAVEA